MPRIEFEASFKVTTKTKSLVVFLMCGLAFPLTAVAESAVTQIGRPSIPYVELYSPCRAAPPNNPAAQEFFRTVQTYRPSFDEYQRQLDSLDSRALDSLSAIDAEVYWLLIGALAGRLTGEDTLADGDHVDTVIKRRARGLRIAERFRDSSFVRCAKLASDVSLMGNYLLRKRFSDKKRETATDQYMSLLESALSGRIETDTYPSVLHYIVGQLYLNRGFQFLPDVDRAAPLFEVGGRHLLDAASNPKDERYIGNWKRYAFALKKLSMPLQIDAVRRLLAYVESSWGGKSEPTRSELDTYRHLLRVAGNIAFSERIAEDAVSISERHLKVVQQLRRRDPQNANYEVDEALGYVLVGDAHVLVGDAKSADRAYQDAFQVYESSGASAKDMLLLQNFRSELDARRKSVPTSTR